MNFAGETTLVVPRKVLRAIAERCREDEALQFNLLTDATCVDRYPHGTALRTELSPGFDSQASSKVRLRVRLSGR